MKIKNIAPGPRGLHAVSGAVILRPGETADVEMDPAEAAVSRSTGWFEMDEDKPAKPARKAE